jgi:tetratricopeptide (TPR) repeat protein
VGVSLSNVAVVLSEQGRYKEAEALSTRALAILTKARGVSPVEAALARLNLVNVRLAMGRKEEVAALLKDAIPVIERLQGRLHPNYLNAVQTLAVAYSAEGREAEAEKLLLDCLHGLEAVAGEESPRLIRTLYSLGELHRSARRFSQAEPFYLRAIAIGERSLSDHHRDLLVTMNNYALLLKATGRGKDARFLKSRVEAGMKRHAEDNLAGFTVSLRELERR